jgi:hypothetical protein
MHKKIEVKAGAQSNYIKPSTDSKELNYREHGLKYSFEDYDSSQCVGFDKWEQLGQIRPMFDKFFHYSKNCKFKSMFDKKFKTYTTFPENSEFKFPENITQDARWASMHLGNKPCVIGHLVDNTFYIVFFDPGHKFYPTKKK